MAFTGAATIKLVSDGIVRITGVSLAAGASGTISLSAGAGDVKCPANVEFQPYKASDGSTVGADDAVDVTVKAANASATPSANPGVTKTGTTAAAFLATITNNNQGSATSGLEIYVKFHT